MQISICFLSELVLHGGASSGGNRFMEETKSSICHLLCCNIFFFSFIITKCFFAGVLIMKSSVVDGTMVHLLLGIGRVEVGPIPIPIP